MTDRELRDRLMSGISESLQSVFGNGDSLNELKSETLRRAALKASHYGDSERAARFRDYADEVGKRESSVRPKANVPDIDTFRIYDLAVIEFGNGDCLHVVRYSWNSRNDAYWNKTRVGMKGDICNRMCLAYVSGRDGGRTSVDVFMIDDDMNTVSRTDVYDDEMWNVKSFFGQHGSIEDGETGLRMFGRKDAGEIAGFISRYVPAGPKGDRVSYRDFYDPGAEDGVEMTMRQVRVQKKPHYITESDAYPFDVRGARFFFVDENDNWEFSRHVICRVCDSIYMAKMDAGTPVLKDETEAAFVLREAKEIHGRKLAGDDLDVISSAGDMIAMIACVLDPDSLKKLDDADAMRGMGEYATLRDVMCNTSGDFDRYTHEDAYKTATCRYIDLKKKDDVLAKVTPEKERFLPAAYFEARRKYEAEDRKRTENAAAAWDAVRKLLAGLGAREADISRIGGAYQVSLFGKRGEYGEYGERTLVRDSMSLCRAIADRLKEITGGVRITSVEISKSDDIDTSYSRYAETECYGTRTMQVIARLSDGKKVFLLA